MPEVKIRHHNKPLTVAAAEFALKNYPGMRTGSDRMPLMKLE